MIWWLAFEKKPFQFRREIWIQVVVILLQLYLVIWKSKLRSEANLSKRSTQNPEQHRRIFESSFLASWVIFTPMIWSSCLSWHNTPFVYCSDGDEPIQICSILKYRLSHRYLNGLVTITRIYKRSAMPTQAWQPNHRSEKEAKNDNYVFDSSFVASCVMIWSSCLSWHSTSSVYCSDGGEPIQNCILLKYRMSHLICGPDTWNSLGFTAVVSF